jgi:hypothetical protein
MNNPATPATAAKQILEMNNFAVARILDDEPSECLEIFRSALHHLQSVLQAQIANGVAAAVAPMIVAASLTQESQSSTSLTQFQSVPLDNPTRNTAALHASQSNGTFSFFHRMMTMAPESLTQLDAAACTDQDASLLFFQDQLLALLFFNMAVAHHHVGLRQGKSSELQTALYLYELAFSMVEGSRRMALGDRQVLLLAIYNNMGHCHSCFCNTDATQACVEWIQKIFWAYPPAARQQQASSKSTTSTKSSLELFDLEFFVQYMPLRPREQGSIASAA